MHHEDRSLGDLLFRIVLRALPASFREEYGDEILSFQRARLRETDGSRWNRIRVTCGSIWDVLMGAVRERVKNARAPGPEPRRKGIRNLQSSIQAIEPGLPIPAVVTSESLVARSTEGQRAGLKMTAGLGFLALLLSAVGVYGVVAYAVSNRTREIGLRMAMGATRKQILRAVLGDAVRLTIPALLVGALLAAGTATAMRSELLGVGPLDPISFGSVAGLLFLVVLLASLVPARRASGIHPMDALRFE